MNLTPQRWKICPVMPEALRSAVPHLPPLLAQLLYNRGVLAADAAADGDALERFLSPRWENGLHDPFLMADMARAVERILAAVDRRERIGVFGHYDADGITATVLLTEALRYLGAQAVPYLPNRSENYGVAETGIARLAGEGVALLVSVDCGVRSFGAPAAAARQGMDVIVTDHHTVLRRGDSDVLPQALAVLNPLRADCRYPFKSLAGVGIAFKLAQALLRADAERRGRSETHYAKWLLDLVCLGTIADVVEITGENRTLVRLGLEILGRSSRPGVRALLDVAGANVNRLDVETVGFQLAPRINAAARIANAWTSMELLQAADLTAAEPLARKLEQLNRKRQLLIRQVMADVAERYGDTLAQRKAIVAAGEWPAGIIGLIAGKLADGYNRPAAVIETGGGEELHGSARSPTGFHIAAALAECGDLLTSHGGHAQAGGFLLPARNLEAFAERLKSLADASIPDEELAPSIPVDLLVEPAQITPDLLAQARRLEPCGPGNPVPVFGMCGARLAEAGAFGSDGEHLRLSLERSGRPLKAVGWRMGALAGSLQAGSAVSVAFSLREDAYCGLVLELLDVVSSGE